MPPRNGLDEVTLGRILERLDMLVERQATIADDVKRSAKREDLAALEKRIEKCESFQLWVYRSVGTAGAAVFAGLAYFGQRLKTL